MSSVASALARFGITQGTFAAPPWIYPPAEYTPIDLIGYISLPAIGATATIVSKKIEPGANGVILGLANNFVGGGFVEGSGALYYQILLDGKPASDDYNQILASLGSPANPTTHPCGFRIFENQLLSLVVTNVSIVVAGQLCGGRLMGWYYPLEYENPNVPGV
jgi:hypothetical protein